MPGIKIRHQRLRSCVALVPLMHKPFPPESNSFKEDCPSCRTPHLVKTIHLWLDDGGACLVSQGVLDDLRKAGMPELVVEAEIKKPPPLRFGPGAGNPSRAQVDQRNRQVRIWNGGTTNG